MKIGTLLKDCLVVAVAMLALLYAISLVNPALASEVVNTTPPESVPLFELLAVLFGSEATAQWIAVIGLVCYVFTLIRPFIPTSWIAALPQPLINFIERIAGNYLGAKNESVVSHKGINKTP